MMMEVDVSSPISQEDEEMPAAIIPPGLDMLVAPQQEFDAQSDEPVTGLQSPFTPAGSPDSPGGSSISPDGGPATPGANMNEESMDADVGPPSPSERSPDDGGEEKEEEEEERGVEEEEKEEEDPSSPLESCEEVEGGVHTPGSPPEEKEEGPASPLESGEELGGGGHTPGSSPQEEAASPLGSSEGAEGGVHTPGSPLPEEENDNNAISYAFLSGQGAAAAGEEPANGGDEDEEAMGSQQVMIPFLGDSTVPVASPGGEEEEEPEKEGEEIELGMGVVSPPTAGEEEVVATTEEAEAVQEPQEEEEVAAEEKEQEKEEEQKEDAPAAASPVRSPEQVVEEVFLSTEAAGKPDASDESEFEGFEAAEATTSPGPVRSKRKRRLILEDDEDEDEEKGKAAVEDESDFEGFEPEEEKKGDRQGLIDDIFGHSDDEGDFEGFAETEVQPAREEEEAAAAAKTQAEEEEKKEEKKKKKKKDDGSSSSSDDEGVADGPTMPSFHSDFEEMMMRKKEEGRRRRRRRGDIDIINNSDDLVVQLISDMKIAAKMDRDLIMQRQPAIQKLRMLPQVVSMLRKADMQMALIDCGVLSAITEWLSPLPDRSLPALQIRSNLLQALGQLPGIGADSLKESGVGKAVMYLNKHPKETGENRRTAGKLVYNWSRPIFDLTSDYKLLSKEARQKRDMDNLPKKRRISADADATPKRDIDREMSADNTPLRPGDPGWVARARVPMPSNKDYVYRPRPKVENAVSESTPKKMTRFEKHMRKIKDSKTKSSKFQKAVGMSLEGRKMSL